MWSSINQQVWLSNLHYTWFPYNPRSFKSDGARGAIFTIFCGFIHIFSLLYSTKQRADHDWDGLCNKGTAIHKNNSWRAITAYTQNTSEAQSRLTITENLSWRYVL